MFKLRVTSNPWGLNQRFLSKLPRSDGPQYEHHFQWMSLLRARQLAAAYSSQPSSNVLRDPHLPLMLPLTVHIRCPRSFSTGWFPLSSSILLPPLPLCCFWVEESINIIFGDFKAAGAAYDLVRDAAMLMNSSTRSLYIKAVGELKVPWVPKHRVSRGFVEQKMTRALIGPLAENMYDLKVKYGWLSNYDETVFLRQVKTGSISYLEYSPVAKGAISHAEGDATPSLRQCFFHLASVAQPQGQVTNTTPKR
ncbi:hypothetical protein N7465_000090 [Penicillium sp. CMV-2018d]|nr:hypothetical protein N7465_000090 [Penicillium sp. CMV-2018d]